MNVVQLNVRLPNELKTAGDKAFAQLGWSATQAVRALWEFAARHAADPAAVSDALVEVGDEELQERQKKLELAHAGQSIVPNFYASIGAPMPKQAGTTDCKEELMTATYECEMERELA